MRPLSLCVEYGYHIDGPRHHATIEETDGCSEWRDDYTIAVPEEAMVDDWKGVVLVGMVGRQLK